MPQLLLMRHAKSKWSDPGLTDHDRPLNGRGRAAAPRMGRWLKSQGLHPDLIMSSTAERARSTAELVAGEFDPEPPVRTCHDLYHSSPATMLESLAIECGDEECVMLVAHNPGIEDFIHETTSRMEFCPTAVVAVIAFDRPWSDLILEACGELKELWRPKELPAECL